VLRRGNPVIEKGNGHFPGEVFLRINDHPMGISRQAGTGADLPTE
jgi:hypothetical protein